MSSKLSMRPDVKVVLWSLGVTLWVSAACLDCGAQSLGRRDIIGDDENHFNCYPRLEDGSCGNGGGPTATACAESAVTPQLYQACDLLTPSTATGTATFESLTDAIATVQDSNQDGRLVVCARYNLTFVPSHSADTISLGRANVELRSSAVNRRPLILVRPEDYVTNALYVSGPGTVISDLRFSLPGANTHANGVNIYNTEVRALRNLCFQSSQFGSAISSFQSKIALVQDIAIFGQDFTGGNGLQVSSSEVALIKATKASNINVAISISNSTVGSIDEFVATNGDRAISLANADVGMIRGMVVNEHVKGVELWQSKLGSLEETMIQVPWFDFHGAFTPYGVTASGSLTVPSIIGNLKNLTLPLGDGGVGVGLDIAQVRSIDGLSIAGPIGSGCNPTGNGITVSRSGVTLINNTNVVSCGSALSIYGNPTHPSRVLSRVSTSLQSAHGASPIYVGSNASSGYSND